MDKYPLLRDQVEKIVVQHGRKGETKSKEQVLKWLECAMFVAMLYKIVSTKKISRHNLHGMHWACTIIMFLPFLNGPFYS